MLYLRSFRFPDREAEVGYEISLRRTCYASHYPFGVLGERFSGALDLEPLTILSGDNGCGKSTAIHVMAEKLAVQHTSLYNRSALFEDYLSLCEADVSPALPRESRVITSDDVFDFVLNLRAMNEGLESRREVLFQEWVNARHETSRMRSLEDYERVRRTVDARRHTQSAYVRDQMHADIREHSNGESSLLYFEEKLREPALYFLDEPENSLSPRHQKELAQQVEESIRFFGCQVVMATHSPFFLSLRGARIYDMDRQPAQPCRWQELGSVRTYFDFFRVHWSALEEKT